MTPEVTPYEPAADGLGEVTAVQWGSRGGAAGLVQTAPPTDPPTAGRPSPTTTEVSALPVICDAAIRTICEIDSST